MDYKWIGIVYCDSLKRAQEILNEKIKFWSEVEFTRTDDGKFRVMWR